MKAIRLKVSLDSDITTLDVGRTVRLGQIPKDVKDTLIDPAILKRGARINLPQNFFVSDPFGRTINHIMIPALSPDGRIEKSGEMVFLHPVTVAGNQLLAYFEQNEGNLSIVVIERLVKLFYLSLMNRVIGNRGVIATNISGTRMAHSGRLVLIPQISRSPEWVGISTIAMKNTGIKEGDLIIIFRDPVIWTGSMEVVRAYPIDDNVIALHPLLFKQLNADCDGDQVAFVKPPQEPEVLREMNDNLLKHTLLHAKWPKYLCHDNLPEDPDWSNIIQDTLNRFTVNGFSYGPGDVCGWISPTNTVREMEKITGKIDRGIVNKDISSKKETRNKIILETNFANLFMKGYLGIVGATARRILLIMGEDPWLSSAANRFSETIQQATLDAKHKISEERTFSPIDIMEMFERRSKWKNSTISESIDLLVRAGIKEEDASRIVYHFRLELPVILFIEVNLKDRKEYYISKLRELTIDSNGNANRKLGCFVSVLDEIAKDMSGILGTEINHKDVNREIKEKYVIGLTELVNTYYPGFALTHKTIGSDLDRAICLFSHVFHLDREDRGSVFRYIWETK
jgi:hypothetical protein